MLGRVVPPEPRAPVRGQSHPTEGKRKSGLAPRFCAEAVAAADAEQERDGVHLLAIEKLGQFFGGKLLAARIKENQLVPVFILTLPPVAAGQR